MAETSLGFCGSSNGPRAGRFKRFRLRRRICGPQLAVHRVEPVVIDLPALATQVPAESAEARAPPLPIQLRYALAQRFVILWSVLVSKARSSGLDQPAGTTFAEAEGLLEIANRCSPGPQLHHFL